MSMLQGTTVFEFLSLWIALESINCLLSDKRPPREGEWRGLDHTFKKAKTAVSFETIKDARNNLLHSLGDVSDKTIAELSGCLESMRQAFVLGIGILSSLPSSKIEVIKQLKPLKKADRLIYVYEGNFTALPSSDDELMINYPEFRLGEQKRILKLNKDGNPSLDLNTIGIARLPKGTVFQVDSTSVFGSKNSGISINLHGIK